MKKLLGNAGAALRLSRILPKPVATDRQILSKTTTNAGGGDNPSWAKSAPNLMFQASEGTCQSVPKKGLVSRRAIPAEYQDGGFERIGDKGPKLLSNFDPKCKGAPSVYSNIELLGDDICKHPIHTQYAALACQTTLPIESSARELRFRELLTPVYDTLASKNGDDTDDIITAKKTLDKHVSAISQSLVFLDSLDARSRILSYFNMFLDCMYTVCQKDLNPPNIGRGVVGDDAITKLLKTISCDKKRENLRIIFEDILQKSIDENGHLHPGEVITHITKVLCLYAGFLSEGEHGEISEFSPGLEPPSATQLLALSSAVGAEPGQAASVFNECVEEMIANVDSRDFFSYDSCKSSDKERPFPFGNNFWNLPDTAHEYKSYARNFRLKHNLYKLSGDDTYKDHSYNRLGKGFTKVPWDSMQKEVEYLCNYLGREIPPVFSKIPSDTEGQTTSEWSEHANLVDQLDLLYAQADRRIFTSILGTFDTKLKEAQKACETHLLSQVLDLSEFISNDNCSLVHNLKLGGQSPEHINLVYPGEYTKRQMSANERLLREATFVFGILGNGMSNLTQDAKEASFVELNNMMEDAGQLLALLGFARKDINKSFALDMDYGGGALGVGTMSRSSQGLNALGQGELADGILDICEIDEKDTNIRETFRSRARKIVKFLLRPSHIGLGLTAIVAFLAVVVPAILLAVGPVGTIVFATLALGFGFFALALTTGLVFSQMPFITLILGASCGFKGWLQNNREEKKYTDLLKRVMNGNEKAITIYKMHKDYTDNTVDSDFVRAEAAKEYVSILGDSAVTRMMKEAKNRLIKLGKDTDYYQDNVRTRGNISKTDFALLSIRMELSARDSSDHSQVTTKLDGVFSNKKVLQDGYTTPYSALKEIVALAAATTQEDFLLTSEPSSASRKRQFIKNIAKVGKALLPDSTTLLAPSSPTKSSSPTVSPQDVVPLKLQLLWQLQGVIAASKGASCIKIPMPAE